QRQLPAEAKARRVRPLAALCLRTVSPEASSVSLACLQLWSVRHLPLPPAHSCQASQRCPRLTPSRQQVASLVDSIEERDLEQTAQASLPGKPSSEHSCSNAVTT